MEDYNKDLITENTVWDENGNSIDKDEMEVEVEYIIF